MKNTPASFHLSSEEICRIIEKCGQSSVESFELDGLIRIKFHPRRNEDAVTPSKASDHNTIPVVSEISTEAEKEEMDLMDQEAIAEAEEAQILIDNASEFEKLQIARHIEKARMSDEKTHN